MECSFFLSSSLFSSSANHRLENTRVRERKGAGGLAWRRWLRLGTFPLCVHNIMAMVGVRCGAQRW